MNKHDRETTPLIVISGGSGFLGSAVVREFVKQGWQVAVLSRKGDAPTGSKGYVCDVTSRSSVDGAIQKIVSEYGFIRACIHAAAAPLERKSLLETSSESFIHTVSVALSGAHHLALSVIPCMKEGAVFIGITSQAIEANSKVEPLGAYIPAKSALRSFLRVLASNTLSQGIRVYAVAPSFLSGGLNSDLPEAVREFIEKKTGTQDGKKDVANLLVKLVMKNDMFPSGTSILLPEEVITPL